MKDPEIRQHFHRKKLRRHHEDQGTLVIDELGLRHGARRADIAVFNGLFLGFEIKSDRDALTRLPLQIADYNAIFDRITVISAEKHLSGVRELVPEWWGITVCTKGSRGAVHFGVQRTPSTNPQVDPLSIARLLWRCEVLAFLQEKGEDARTLRHPRRILYARLVECMKLSEIKQAVKSSLMSRAGWRCPPQPSQCGDLSRPSAK